LSIEDRQLLIETRERLVEVGGVVEAMGGELNSISIKVLGAISGLEELRETLNVRTSDPMPITRLQDAPQNPTTITGDPIPTDGSYNPRAGARRMLEVLARRYPLTTTKPQLRLMAKLRKSGTSETYYRELINHALIQEDDGGWITITQEGFGIMGITEPPNPLTREENIASFRGIFRAGARRMLDILLDIHPKEILRDELFQRAGLTNSGTSNTYLRDLTRNDAAEVNGNMIRAGEALFL